MATTVLHPLCSRDTSRATCSVPRCVSTTTPTVPRWLPAPGSPMPGTVPRNAPDQPKRRSNCQRAQGSQQPQPGCRRPPRLAVSGREVTLHRRGASCGGQRRDRAWVGVDAEIAVRPDSLVIPIHGGLDLGSAGDEGLHLLNEAGLPLERREGGAAPFGNEHRQPPVRPGKPDGGAEQRLGSPAETLADAAIIVVAVGGYDVDLARSRPVRG